MKLRLPSDISIGLVGHKKQGKSTWLRAMLARSYDRGRPYVVLDPFGEFGAFGATVTDHATLEAALASPDHDHVIYQPPGYASEYVAGWCDAVLDCTGWAIVADDVAAACGEDPMPRTFGNLLRAVHKSDNALFWSTHGAQDASVAGRLVDWWIAFWTKVDRHKEFLRKAAYSGDEVVARIDELDPYDPRADRQQGTPHRWILDDGINVEIYDPVTPPSG